MTWGPVLRLISLVVGIAFLVLGIWLQIELSTREYRTYSRGRGAPFAYALAFVSLAFARFPKAPPSRSDRIMARARRQHGLDRRSPWPTVVFVAIALSSLALGTWLLLPVLAP